MRGYAEARVYGENELGGLRRTYVLTAPPKAYGLPEAPEYPGEVTLWQTIVQPFGYIAAGLTAVGLAINMFLTRRDGLNHHEAVGK